MEGWEIDLQVFRSRGVLLIVKILPGLSMPQYHDFRGIRYPFFRIHPIPLLTKSHD